MLTKYSFELALERVAEKFYFQGATQYGKVRGGNSAENEAYFRNVATDLRGLLSCQQILLKKGSCPDSGVFGEFDYKNEEDVNWRLVENKQLVVLEVMGVNRQKRYIEIPVSEIDPIEEPVKKNSGIEINLNNVNSYGELFGVEYKAAKSNSKMSINVASFNSTCPSATKTSILKKIKMIHNYESKNAFLVGDKKLKFCEVTLSISFSIYYLIVNDDPNGQISEIKQIFVCDGGFFAPDMSEEDAKSLSRQLYPVDLKIPYELYRVGLRYRPFFDSKTIRANGYGLYTSWEPKIPAAEEEGKQRELLMKEVERVQQDFSRVVDEDELKEAVNNETKEIAGNKENPDNIIYLTLREDRIKKRAA